MDSQRSSLASQEIRMVDLMLQEIRSIWETKMVYLKVINAEKNKQVEPSQPFHQPST
jgi:hypothetical protein